MAVKFTEEQRKAIDTLDKSILVSAAAGSGKTAVLVQRILNIILEGRANVDEMLVVTFTKAAAAEMKLRLGKEIRKRMREHPEDSRRLREQLTRLYRAYITTIDSFALRVIKEFFHEIDLEPGFGACDEIQAELLKKEAAAELFEDAFEEDGFIEGCGFREFLRLYSSDRSDEKFKEDLIEAYDRLRAMPDYFSWAYESAEVLKTTAETFDTSRLKEVMLEDAKESFGGAAEAAVRMRNALIEAGLEDLYREKLEGEVEAICGIASEVSNGRLDAEIFDRLAEVSFARMNLRKAWREAYASIKDEIDGLRKIYKEEINNWKSRYLEPDFGSRLAEMNSAYKYTIYYIRLLEEFEKRFRAKKDELHVLDFADMEHYAVRILCDDRISAAMRKRFRFVFVDEYQDTNNIQEYLISKVSRPDNIFKVGDLKQSIYRFRHAQPEIFESVYREYSDPDNKDGIAIDLGKNFRSNDGTIRFINHVFERIMEGYDERAMLYTGTKCDPEFDFIPEIHILTDEKNENEADREDDDEDAVDLSKEEAEAAYIAEIVRGIIGTEFHDTKKDEVRKARPGDIVILYRVKKERGEIMMRALRTRGIESHIEDSDNYFDTVEIGIALSLLTCIDNMKRDVPLIATLHSDIFGWTSEELAVVRIAYRDFLMETEGRERRTAFWEALEWYIREGPEGDLRAKAVQAADKILEWRRLSRMMPLEDFIWKALTDSGCYRMAGAMNGGARRQANLRVLADRAGKFSRENVSSLSSYIAFVDVMRKKNISNGQAPVSGADDDVVRISSIHKSKGLEYPFVIVGNLGKSFRKDKTGKKLSCDPAVGVSMPYVDPSRRFWRSTLLQRAIESKSQRDYFREELRILYVAMTRARNKLILTGTCGDPEELMKYSVRPGSYLKVMRDVIRSPFNRYYISPLERKETVLNSGNSGRTALIPEILDPEEQALYDEIDRRFRFEYPDSELLTAKAKYSVSAIRMEELREPEEPVAVSQDHEVVNLWTVNENRKKAGAADIGIVYHRIMEFLDFTEVIKEDGSVDEEYIRQAADSLAEKGAVDAEAYRSVKIDKAADFFRSDLGRRAVRAAERKSLKKEKAFTLKTQRRGKSMLVQGVIDCCFEEEGRMILIDYKSSFIRPGAGHEAEIERIRNEYRVQIELYSEAIKKGTGLETGEAYLYLFATGEAVQVI